MWLARDLNQDGDLADAGEGLARWVSKEHPGRGAHRSVLRPAEPSGALVNIQHPTSGNDRTIEITVPYKK